MGCVAHGPCDFIVSSSPLRTNLGFELGWTGLGLGPGLDNYHLISADDKNPQFPTRHFSGLRISQASTTI